MSTTIVDYAAKLLNVSGIEKVISIDDDNSNTSSPEEMLGVLASIDDQALAEIGALVGVESGDRDIIRDKVKNEWKVFDEPTRDAVLARLTPPVEELPESVALLEDLRATSRLPKIFGDKLVAVTLTEWEKRFQEYVHQDMPPTLLLVDLSFKGEERGNDEGLRVIANLLKMHPESKIYCGLLTSLYHIASVHEDWKKIAADNELDTERFVLIPKDSLDQDGQPFLALIKLVVMNGPANSLRKAMVAAFSDCLMGTEKSVEQIDVFEFERIVCLTSSVEGVWEPDTLLRIVSMFHKNLVRQVLRKDAKVFGYADSLRALSAVPVGEWGAPTEMEISLRRLEWFEEAKDLNGLHLPLELGDVFEIKSKPDKLFVLLAQPCDLMMRQSGKRHETVENALLLEATHIPRVSEDEEGSAESDLGFSFRLDFYEANRDWKVSLRKSQYVNLDVLDLCVFDSEGQAHFSEQDKAPTLLPISWRSRHPRLAKIMGKSAKRYGELMKMAGMKHADAAKLALTSSMGNLFQVEIDAKRSLVKFDIQRVGRIKQPRAAALLARYANALARDAFEHDLTRRPRLSSKPLEGTLAPRVEREEAHATSEPTDDLPATIVISAATPTATNAAPSDGQS